MSGYVRAYRDGDELILAPNVRRHDADEILAFAGVTPLEGLRICASHSTILCSIIDDSHAVVGMFGVVRVDDMSGKPWLIGADALTRPPLSRQFLRECRGWVDRMHTQFPLLYDHIDARNTVHIRWLKWMGFTFIKLHERFGVGQLPFYEFVRVQDASCRINRYRHRLDAGLHRRFAQSAE